MPLSTVGKIGFIGGGNMAEAFIKGLIAGGFPAEDIHFFEPNEQRRDLVVERYGITCSENNAALVAESDIIVLATKPQILEKVLGEINGSFGSQGPERFCSQPGYRNRSVDHLSEGCY